VDFDDFFRANEQKITEAIRRPAALAELAPDVVKNAPAGLFTRNEVLLFASNFEIVDQNVARHDLRRDFAIRDKHVSRRFCDHCFAIALGLIEWHFETPKRECQTARTGTSAATRRLATRDRALAPTATATSKCER